MNWIRDNILKVLLILGVVVVVIIIIAIAITPKGDDTVSGSKYGELETKLQNAAIKYMNSHKKKLPKSTEETTTINLKTLQADNYIGNIVAVDNRNTKCTGVVEIDRITEDEEIEYRYTPYITCGKYYTTKNIGNYIIDLETKDGEFERTTDAGLYKIGDSYVFRGENVNNYIQLGSRLYRIIKIDANKQLQLISTEGTEEAYTWDDRYNVSKDSDVGINDFLKSRLYDTLQNLYDSSQVQKFEKFFSDEEKDYIIPHDFCIGKRSSTDENINSGAECSETIGLNVGLIAIDEYMRASIDPNCTSISDKSCMNYNYFTKLGKRSTYSYVTLTAVADNTYEYYRVNYDELLLTKTVNAYSLYPVIYINAKTIYSYGTGTILDPYIVR